jgi:hypothetical protein
MRKSSIYLLCLAISVITFSNASVSSATSDDAKDSTSFKSVYDSLSQSSEGKELELAKEADADAKKKQFTNAAAKYLAAAQPSLISSRFEIARTNLDKTFLMASKLSAEDQKELLKTLSEIVSKCFNRMSPDAYKYLAQQRLKLLRSQPGATAESKFGEIQTVAFACSQHKRYQEVYLLAIITDSRTHS